MTKNGGDMKVEWKKFKVEEIWFLTCKTNFRIITENYKSHQWMIFVAEDYKYCRKCSKLVWWGDAFTYKGWGENLASKSDKGMHALFIVTHLQSAVNGSFPIKKIQAGSKSDRHSEFNVLLYLMMAREKYIWVWWDDAFILSPR